MPEDSNKSIFFVYLNSSWSDSKVNIVFFCFSYIIIESLRAFFIKCTTYIGIKYYIILWYLVHHFTLRNISKSNNHIPLYSKSYPCKFKIFAKFIYILFRKYIDTLKHVKVSCISIESFVCTFKFFKWRAKRDKVYFAHVVYIK